MNKQTKLDNKIYRYKDFEKFLTNTYPDNVITGLKMVHCEVNNIPQQAGAVFEYTNEREVANGISFGSLDKFFGRKLIKDCHFEDNTFKRLG